MSNIWIASVSCYAFVYAAAVQFLHAFTCSLVSQRQQATSQPCANHLNTGSSVLCTIHKLHQGEPVYLLDWEAVTKPRPAALLSCHLPEWPGQHELKNKSGRKWPCSKRKRSPVVIGFLTVAKLKAFLMGSESAPAGDLHEEVGLGHCSQIKGGFQPLGQRLSRLRDAKRPPSEERRSLNLASRYMYSSGCQWRCWEGQAHLNDPPPPLPMFLLSEREKKEGVNSVSALGLSFRRSCGVLWPVWNRRGDFWIWIQKEILTGAFWCDDKSPLPGSFVLVEFSALLGVSSLSSRNGRAFSPRFWNERFRLRYVDRLWSFSFASGQCQQLEKETSCFC